MSNFTINTKNIGFAAMLILGLVLLSFSQLSAVVPAKILTISTITIIVTATGLCLIEIAKMFIISAQLLVKLVNNSKGKEAFANNVSLAQESTPKSKYPKHYINDKDLLRKKFPNRSVISAQEAEMVLGNEIAKE